MYTVIGNNYVNDYKITVPINYKNLEVGKEYNVDYHLIIECSENMWLKILNNIKNFIK